MASPKTRNTEVSGLLSLIRTDRPLGPKGDLGGRLAQWTRTEPGLCLPGWLTPLPTIPPGKLNFPPVSLGPHAAWGVSSPGKLGEEVKIWAGVQVRGCVRGKGKSKMTPQEKRQQEKRQQEGGSRSEVPPPGFWPLLLPFCLANN